MSSFISRVRVIFAPKGLLHREPQNCDVRRSVTPWLCLRPPHLFWSILGPRKLQNCFEGSILAVQKRFQSVTSAKLLWRKHMCDQKGDLFWWDLHLVELTCMPRRHTDRRTSKFWGSLCKSPFGATLPCRCNLVYIYRAFGIIHDNCVVRNLKSNNNTSWLPCT